MKRCWIGLCNRTWTGDRWVKVWIGSRSNRSCTNNQRIQYQKDTPASEVKKEWGMNTHRWQWQWLCLALFWNPFGTFTCKSPKLAGSSRRGMPSPRILTTCPSDSRRFFTGAAELTCLPGGAWWHLSASLPRYVLLISGFSGSDLQWSPGHYEVIQCDSTIRTNDIQWLYTDEVLTSAW